VSSTHRTVRFAAVIPFLLAVSAVSCVSSLPEPESSEAKLYATRCGSCHAPHQPRALTPAMWKVQVERMDRKFREARIQPPSAEEKEKILAYLTRNAAQ
jgi:hypothetical protein